MGVLSGLLRRLEEADAVAQHHPMLAPALSAHRSETSASGAPQPVDTSDATGERQQAQDGPTIERRAAWQVLRNGKPICTMVGEPLTHAKALEAARWRWADAMIQRQPDIANGFSISTKPGRQADQYSV